jgi:hypothetical protein
MNNSNKADPNRGTTETSERPREGDAPPVTAEHTRSGDRKRKSEGDTIAELGDEVGGPA